MTIVIIVLLVLLLLGGAPTWGYHQYGWGPSGIFGFILIVLCILILTGRA